MAGKPKRSRSDVLANKLAELDKRIDSKEAELKKLNSERDEIMQELDSLRVQEILELMEEKNLSIDELKGLLESR